VVWCCGSFFDGGSGAWRACKKEEEGGGEKELGFLREKRYQHLTKKGCPKGQIEKRKKKEKREKKFKCKSKKHFFPTCNPIQAMSTRDTIRRMPTCSVNNHISS